MSECQVNWKQDEKGDYVWECKKNFISTSRAFPAEKTHCYKYGCRGRRGYYHKGVKVTDFEAFKKEQGFVKEPVVEEEVAVLICAWHKCDQPVAPNKLRHCSEVCRKRQNRYDYKQRKKAEKLQQK